ncbi:semaphorin-4A isoform X2 [Colossoma macropomum]|uniref:semaphorin-4A isoform X2 n=1 Tax=Colossoma macropomum TaxID=42526 RepID=UPI001864E6BA|nr:semaphorin-4A isoform X2 [Colossoma macropomum]
MAFCGLLSVCLSLIIIIGGCHGNTIPRITFLLDSPGRAVSIFNPPDVYNTTTLLLSKDEETLFVGARNALLSLSVNEGGGLILNRTLDWSPTVKDLNDCSMKGKEKTDCPNFVRVLQVLNSTHMYACGTFAFSPRCTYISSQQFSLVTGGKPEEGRGRCPYNPYQKNTAITVGGELYTGTVADYRGNRPVISRHLSDGGHVDLKLDDTLGWLDEPTFISSASIPSEEKVYFFFSEMGREYDFIDKFTVSRIAQVCTSDNGGQRTLQRRWTTFTKAQLLCQASGELPYNVLQDMTTLQPAEGAAEDDTLFYGIFSSQWSVNSGRSAVCVFSLRDIKEVFAGNYKSLSRDTLKWTTRVQEKITNPGECGLHNASDNMLRFVKENFLADKSVLPVNQELAMVSPEHHYSNIAAQRVGLKGKEYTVLYLLTETGFLHKAVLLEKGVHIIEEIQVLTRPQLVKNLLLSTSKGVVLVGSSEGVVSVPVSNCSYYSSCAECVLARDPFCGWDPSHKACTDISSIKGNARQDVDEGNVSKACEAPITPRSRSGSGSLKTPASELVSVSLNEVVRLQCPAVSHLAQLHWERPNSQISPKIYMQQEDGSLSFLATPSTLGLYLCKAEENGFTQTLITYQVRQKSSPTLQPVTPSRPQVTQSSETGQAFTTKWVTTLRAREETMQPNPNMKEPQPTVSVRETQAVTTSKSSTNFSENKQGRLEVGVAGGEHQLLAKTPSYLQELVVVSVLLALCISALLTIALFSVRQRCRSRTAPHSPGSQRAGGASPQESEALRGNSPSGGKRNGHANNAAKSPNTLSNGSNGHLPNTPI